MSTARRWHNGRLTTGDTFSASRLAVRSAVRGALVARLLTVCRLPACSLACRSTLAMPWYADPNARRTCAAVHWSAIYTHTSGTLSACTLISGTPVADILTLMERRSPNQSSPRGTLYAYPIRYPIALNACGTP